MPEVIGIRFKQAGPIYYFAPTDIEVEVGDLVVVDTNRGPAMGKVVIGQKQVQDRELAEPLKPVIRKAEAEEARRAEEFKAKHEEALASCAELVTKYNLPMKLVAAEYNFDGSHLTIYFSAESKVDFRALLRELGSALNARVELRQIGARDVAKLLGGIGRCGRTLCCATHLCKFDPISVRMARDQDLPLNPTKISGVCGKLLCCLSYENQQYLTAKAKLPAVGTSVITPQGPARVMQINTLRETVKVQFESEATLEFPVSQINKAKNGE